MRDCPEVCGRRRGRARPASLLLCCVFGRCLGYGEEEGVRVLRSLWIVLSVNGSRGSAVAVLPWEAEVR